MYYKNNTTINKNIRILSISSITKSEALIRAQSDPKTVPIVIYPQVFPVPDLKAVRKLQSVGLFVRVAVTLSTHTSYLVSTVQETKGKSFPILKPVPTSRSGTQAFLCRN